MIASFFAVGRAVPSFSFASIDHFDIVNSCWLWCCNVATCKYDEAAGCTIMYHMSNHHKPQSPETAAYHTQAWFRIMFIFFRKRLTYLANDQLNHLPSLYLLLPLPTTSGGYYGPYICLGHLQLSWDRTSLLVQQKTAQVFEQGISTKVRTMRHRQWRFMRRETDQQTVEQIMSAHIHG
jgi:hypothetical protein